MRMLCFPAVLSGFLLLAASLLRGDVPPSAETPWLAMDRGPYFTASIESSLPKRQVTPKGILIRVSPEKQAYVLFDSDLIRYSGAWVGGSIDFHNVLFDGTHQTWSKAVGSQLFGNGMIPGWAGKEGFEDPRQRFASVDYLPQPANWQHRAYGPLPHDWARYRGLYVHGDQVILAYNVGGVGVLDSPGWEETAAGGTFTRTLRIEKSTKDLTLQVLEHPLKGGGVAIDPTRINQLTKSGQAGGSVVIVGQIPVEQPAEAPDHPPRIPSDGLVCAWTLDPANKTSGGATVNTYAVTLNGGVSVDGPPAIGGHAVALKSTEFGMVNDSEGVDLSSDFSIAAWVQTSTGGTIFSKTTAGRWVPGGKAFFIRNGTVALDIGWVGGISSSAGLRDNRWYHVAVTYRKSDGSAQLFVDGDADGSAKLKSVPDPAGSRIRFGVTSDNFPTGAANHFEGQLGPIHLFRRALTPQEVAQMAGGPHRKRVRPVAVGTVGAGNQLSWELTDQSQLRLHIPASATPTSIKLLFSPVESPDSPAAFALAVKKSSAPTDLSTLTHGGPAHWPAIQITHGTLSSAAHPYVIDTLPLPTENPWKSRMRLGGFDFFKDGHRAAVCTWDGDIWIVDGIDDKLQELHWRRIAAGMFQPLGLKIVPDSQGHEQIYVCCRDQITRLHDLNGDGETDFYESFNNDHQVTEHFHEFAMDLQTDAAGNFYYGKGGRHALPAVVPQHGTILKVSQDGSKTEIVCTGLRAPNGVGIGPNGQIVTSDQEGHWTPANRIDLIKPGGFYGYMSSYAGASRTPEQGYDLPLCWLPVNLDRSPAEELWVTSDKWGPLNGRMIHTSYGTGLMFLVMHEDVNGIPQGGVVPFPDLQFDSGSMRARFNAGDGQLYVCGLVGWSSNLGIPGGFYRVRYTGKKIYLPVDLRIRRDTVAMTFSEPLNKTSAEDVQNYGVQQWQYRWTAKYGSPHYRISDPSKEGQDDVTVTTAKLSADGKTVALTIPGLKPVMQMQIEVNLDAADGSPVHAIVHNTINVVQNSTAP